MPRPSGTEAHCRAIAGRAADPAAGLGDVEAVELATSRFDVIDYYGDPSPLARDVHARCAVPRP